jgi:hypothetical protein
MTATAMASDGDEHRARSMSFAERQQLRAVPPPVDPTPSTQDVQALTEGAVVDDADFIEFLGKKFRLAESIGLMPLLKFAHSAKTGLTSDDMEGLSAMYLLIRSCLDRSQVQATNPDGTPMVDESGQPVWSGPSQWDLFEAHAIDTNADGEDLSGLINRAVQVVSARPRKRRGGSSASSPQTSPSSRESSSSPGTRRVPPGFEDMTRVADLGR